MYDGEASFFSFLVSRLSFPSFSSQRIGPSWKELAEFGGLVAQ